MYRTLHPLLSTECITGVCNDAPTAVRKIVRPQITWKWGSDRTEWYKPWRTGSAVNFSTLHSLASSQTNYKICSSAWNGSTWQLQYLSSIRHYSFIFLQNFTKCGYMSTDLYKRYETPGREKKTSMLLVSTLINNKITSSWSGDCCNGKKSPSCRNYQQEQLESQCWGRLTAAWSSPPEQFDSSQLSEPWLAVCRLTYTSRHLVQVHLQLTMGDLSKFNLQQTWGYLTFFNFAVSKFEEWDMSGATPSTRQKKFSSENVYYGCSEWWSQATFTNKKRPCVLKIQSRNEIKPFNWTGIGYNYLTDDPIATVCVRWSITMVSSCRPAKAERAIQCSNSS